MYCRQSRNIQPVLFQTGKPRYLQRCTAIFTRQCSTSSSRVVDNREVGHYTSKNFWWYIRSLYYRIRNFSKFATSRFFLFPRLKEHWKAVAVLTFRLCRRRWQNTSAEFQKGFSKTASKTPRNEGNYILMQAEAIPKEILSTRL